MQSVSHPDGLPRLFLDRSLGSVKGPGILRGAGLCLITLSEQYGRPRDESVTDPVVSQVVSAADEIHAVSLTSQ